MSNFTWERIQTSIIIILVIVILLMRSCGNGITIFGEGKKEEPRIVTKIDTVWKEVEIEKIVYVPKWRTKIETEYDTTYIQVPINVDTLEILKDYYTKYVYEDTLRLDSIGYVTVIDTITQNSIFNRSFNAQLQIPTKIINRDIYINQREFYAGFGTRISGNNFNWIGLEGVFRNKNGQTFTLGVGTDYSNKLSIGGGVQWKIDKD